MSELYDRSARLQAEAAESRIQFLKNELALCFTLAEIAQTEYGRGAHQHAELALDDAEKGYSTLMRFLTEPRHAKHINDEVRQKLTAEAKQLRATLDGVRRLRR